MMNERIIVKPLFIWLAIVGFFLIFPLDAFSQLFIGEGRLPLGMTGILVSSIIVINYLFVGSKYGYKNYRLITVVSVVSVFFFIGASIYYRPLDYFVWYKHLCYFVLGYYFIQCLQIQKLNIVRNQKWRKLLVLFWFLFFITTIMFKVEEQNYLRIADGFALLSFLVLLGSNRTKSLLFFIIAIVGLYFIGSRASLAFFIMAGIFLYGKALPRKYFVAIAIIFGLAISAYISSVYLSLLDLNENRYVRLLYDYDNDSSLLLREKFRETGLQVIKENPFVGEFGYYRANGDGEYVHDFISFGAEFGIFGFIMFGFLSLPQVLTIIRSFMRKNLNISTYFASLLAVYSLCGILFAKNNTWPVFYFSAGVSLFAATVILPKRLKK